MGQNSRDKKAKHPKRNKINLLSNLSWNLKPSNLQITSKQKVAACKVRDCELPKLIALLADVATGIWRIKNKFSDVDIDGLPDEIKKAHRHHESICDMLKNAKVEIRDHTGEKFPQGNPALKVIAFQPTPSVQYEVIAETIKPTIYYNGRLIQMGQVIVETPQSKNSNEKLSSANSSSDRTSKQNNKDLAKNTEQSAKTENPQDIDKNKERNKK